MTKLVPHIFGGDLTNATNLLPAILILRVREVCVVRGQINAEVKKVNAYGVRCTTRHPSRYLRCVSPLSFEPQRYQRRAVAGDTKPEFRAGFFPQ